MSYAMMFLILAVVAGMLKVLFDVLDNLHVDQLWGNLSLLASLAMWIGVIGWAGNITSAIASLLVVP